MMETEEGGRRTRPEKSAGADGREEMIRKAAEELKCRGRLGKEQEYFQHGSTTVLEHSLRVADLSLRMAQRCETLGIRTDMDSLVRGALLHDYFLYDWHEKDKSHRLHGFTHPGRALKNAREDFALNAVEENIIARHMFPLTPVPPCCREAWIVCLADKWCAAKETAEGIWGRRGREARA